MYSLEILEKNCIFCSTTEKICSVTVCMTYVLLLYLIKTKIYILLKQLKLSFTYSFNEFRFVFLPS